MSDQPKGTNVQVAIRCRPPNAEEKKGGNATVVSCNAQNKQVSVSYNTAGKKTQKMFAFDRVFGMYSTQEEVFDSMVQPIIEETLAGFNCTIFAYGQTGTGKTHTMEGDINCEENAGIVPRSVREIIERLESRGAEFTIRVSFLELYNEELQDLLATDVTSKDKGPLRLCEDVKKGVVCQNLEEVTVLSASDIFDILKRGIKQRQTAATLCNKNSSRSHSIFTMKIMIKETNVEGEEVVRNGQLNLVDLAGSECVGRSGAKNARAREAGSINQSLLTLGRVITALVDHHGHIPYRDSKLTRLLQESLGGKAKTCIIATLSPSQLAVEESLSTLDYASKAKSIKNVPQVNQKMTKKTVMKEYCAEIESLRNMLQLTREKNGVYLDPATFENMETRLSSQELQLTECESALQLRNDEVKAMRTEIDTVREELEEVRQSLTKKASELEETEKSLEKKTKESDHFQLEWKASEAVVSEQQETESSLASHVQSLQQDVSEHQSDISGLFGKIDRHSDKEKERISQCHRFSEIITSKQNLLQSSIEKSLHESQIESEELCNGVGSMLDKGKSVCSDLEKSIAEALVVLVGDTTQAKDGMVSSCTELTKALSGTQKEVVDSLVHLKQNLSGWLGEVQSSMTSTQDILARQQQTLSSFHDSILKANEEFTESNNSFLEIQQSHSDSLNSDISELKQSISAAFAKFREDSSRRADSNREMLKKKQEAMQKAMQEMLFDLVASQETHTREVEEAGEEFSSSLSSAAESKLQEVQQSCSTASAALIQKNSDIKSNVDRSYEVFQQAVREARGTSEEASAAVGTVVDSVEGKRLLLDESTASLSTSVSQSIALASEEVQKTASTAESMVNEVTAASHKMKTSCSQSTESFTAFLGGTGEEINAKLTTHFRNLQTSLSSEVRVVEEVGEENSVFVRDISGALQPTGATPAKKQPKPLQAVASTRAHDDIKEEVRSMAPTREPSPEGDGRAEEEDTTSLSLDCQSEVADDRSNHGLDVENIAPESNSVANLRCSSNEDEDDDLSVNSKASSVSTGSRGARRTTGIKTISTRSKSKSAQRQLL